MPPSDAPAENASKENSDLSALFTRRYTYGGREVLRPMWFYISLNKNGYGATRRLVVSHGGKVRSEPGDRSTSKEICLVDPYSKAPKDGRPAYSVEYVQSCINARQLLNVEEFRIPSVGRPRRTPPKQHPVVNNEEHQPQWIRTQTLGVEETTQGKDSEMTDDLPCMIQTEDQSDIQRLVRNSQKPNSVIDSTSALQKTSNMEDIKDADGDKYKKRQDHIGAKGQSQHAKLVAPKKRKGEWNVVTETELANNMEADSSPQPVSPFLDSMDWTKSEDNEITRLCMDAKAMYQEIEVDPNEVFTLACWSKFAKQDLLPKGRTAKACFKRAKELWKNGDAEKLEPAENPSSNGSKTKRARLPSEETDLHDAQEHRIEPAQQPDMTQAPDWLQSHDAQVDRIEPDHQPDIPQGPGIPQSQEEEKHLNDERPAEKLKNANRRETREYIVELVTRIAKRGKVTKRKAFRALRNERGHWKRALRHLIDRRETTDA